MDISWGLELPHNRHNWAKSSGLKSSLISIDTGTISSLSINMESKFESMVATGTESKSTTKNELIHNSIQMPHHSDSNGQVMYNNYNEVSEKNWVGLDWRKKTSQKSHSSFEQTMRVYDRKLRENAPEQSIIWINSHYGIIMISTSDEELRRVNRNKKLFLADNGKRHKNGR